MSIRSNVARGALALAAVMIAWLPLGVLNVVPFVLALHDEPALRLHGGAAVVCLLTAAWGYWEQPRALRLAQRTSQRQQRGLK